MKCEGKVLILGYGNPLRADDGFGWQAAERLMAEAPNLDIRALHQLTPELAEPLSQANHAIFIDAAREGVPGELRQHPVEPQPAGAFTHHITPPALLALARDLYGRVPQAVLFTAAGASFEHGMELSADVQQAVGKVCERVLSYLQEL